MLIVYRATLTITTPTGASLDDAALAKIADDIEQVVEGPRGTALVEAIIAALGDEDTFDVTFV